MRHILFAAAALAASGFFIAGPASAQQAQPGYTAGGPMQTTGWCKVSTDASGDDKFGFYQPCGHQARARAPRRVAITAQTDTNAYDAGGPKRIGNMCRVNTSTSGDMDVYGYYAPCAQ